MTHYISHVDLTVVISILMFYFLREFLIVSLIFFHIVLLVHNF